MTAIKVPTTSDGLMEVLSDPAKVREYFSEGSVKNGTTKEFLDAYAKQARYSNPDTDEDMRTQVQSIMFDMIRDNGGGRKPVGDLGKMLSFRGGRPELQLTGDRAVAKGRGAVYNKASAGAKFERDVKEEDRFASIGDYCRAIREEARPSASKDRDDLLRKLNNVRAFQNSFGSEDPGAGGFLIPEVMRSELLQLALEESVVRSRATVIPMSTLRVPIPMVDDTSHSTSVFGGVQFYWEEEAASITESAATFGRVQLEARKLSGYFTTPNELLADAPGFGAWFDQRVPAGLAWFEDVAFLTGNGAGKPLGCIGGPNPAYVEITRKTTSHVNWDDIRNMYARMLPQSLKSAVWIASIDTFPDLANMTLSGSAPGVWLGGYAAADASDAPPVSILGRPVFFTEKVGPLGSPGDLSFVDFSYYLIGDRQAVSVSSSEHVAFQQDKTAYKLIERVDGRPWVQTPLTPHNGSSSTLSPYVGIAT